MHVHSKFCIGIILLKWKIIFYFNFLQLKSFIKFNTHNTIRGTITWRKTITENSVYTYKINMGINQML